MNNKNIEHDICFNITSKKSNIIKNDMSINVLFDFLDIFSPIVNNNYVFNKEIYKKYIYNDKIDGFCKLLKKYYKRSKFPYLEREMSFIKFVTILRQLCNHLNIEYKTNTKYDKNTYNIIYYIKQL
tara:strand:+ start:6808 stop:7185 length:378 start_codon:yes stop_codon:yes gene_type:complete